MVLKVSERGRVAPFIVMDVLRDANERAAEGHEVLHLEVGQPGTPAPRAVIEAASAALNEELIGYSNAMGISPLREAIAGHYEKIYGLTIDPARIMVTTGSSGGFLLSFLGAFDAGDRIAMAAPGYPAYRNILIALGIEPVLLETSLEDRFQPTVDLLKQAGPIDGLIIASPSNPAGTLVKRNHFKDLVDFCDDAGVRIISDEIYHGITYQEKAVSALELSDHAIVINSFSKYFSMTGWRLGWMVLPVDLIRPAECLGQNLFISAPTLSQHAGIAAFNCYDELDRLVETYAESRALLLDELPKAGFDRLAPADGAFYIYADVSGLTNDSEAFCRRMLHEAGVAATPGKDFDPQRGHRFVRFSFAGQAEQIARAADRLQRWLR
ncbi:MAG: pyridoxal phosphate-dependent aminotransferase [Kiloniellales bacterium]|nr:pyridoxal phosphate-dependent aminotransferase [Kiloniellales bacterium]